MIVRKNFEYLDVAEVLIRVYENQEAIPKDDELFCGEVLYRDQAKEPQRFTAPMVRGIVTAVCEALDDIPFATVVQISNEIPSIVGKFEHCDEHFEKGIAHIDAIHVM